MSKFKLSQRLQTIVWLFVTLLWLIVAILLLMSLISYTPSDPSWSHLGSHRQPISNLAGMSGAWLSDILYTFFGVASWWLVLIACFESWQIWRTIVRPNGIIRLIGYVVLLVLTAICMGLIGLLNNDLTMGGMIGQMTAPTLSQFLTTIVSMILVTILLALVLAYTFNIQQLFAFNRKRQQAIEADAQAIYEYLQANTNKNLENLTLSGLEMDNVVNADYQSAYRQNNFTRPNSTNESHSVLGEFLHETGFNDERNDVWEANHKSNNAFLPIGSVYLQNAKLTSKLDEKLQAEVINTNKGFEKVYEKKNDEKSEKKTEKKSGKPTMWQSHDTTTFQPLQSNVLKSQVFEQQVVVKEEIIEEEVEEIVDTVEEVVEIEEENAIVENVEIDHTKNEDVPPVEKPTVIEFENVGVLVDTQEDVFANLGNSIYQATREYQPHIEQISHEDLPENPTFTENLTNQYQEVEPPQMVETVVENYQPVPTYDDEPLPSHQPQQDFYQQIPVSDELAITENPSINDDYPLPDNNPMDIHNDALFAHKSRAMQVAKHRANLSPIPEWSLLDLPDANRKPSYTPEQLQQLSELLEIKLQEFNIKAQVVNAQMGPVVTRFEVELAPGVKASKVTGIARDLARSLSMASVRVVEVIPGKPYIGIEIPNIKREMVRLIELLQTPAFQDPEGLLSMAMGKDISGRPVISDLAKAPHMLVAGTTGSGKSVLVNSLLLSLLLKYTPDNLRLILIDPKQLELANYNDIPHLLTPVITDMTEATSGLAWCVAEMERRYQLMSLFKVRKLAEFNKKVAEAEQNGLPLLDPLWRMTDSALQDKPPKLKPLPQIVIVADEFADMIMQVGKQAEELITRLAQKSRAAGIHLILATQRPSVDVITGLIKANIPVRCGLRVNSKIDSRTILDAGGAEDMLGHGDMLFLGPGQNEPVRVHGAFISDAEVNRVCDAWRERGAPDYIDNMFDNYDVSSGSTNNQSDNSSGGTFGDDDPLYDEVVAFVIETRKVSASSIQRKFSIGYNRAARIVDAMEQAGLVGAMGKNGKRELLM